MRKYLRLLFCMSILSISMLTSSAGAATMSSNLGEPVVDDADIANLAGSIGTDKWWAQSGGVGYPKGQTFTTGIKPVWVKSISYQISDGQKAEPAKTYIIRLGTIYGSAFTEIHSETATQGFTWNAGEFMTWTFETPILLAPFTEYGIDVGLTSSTSSWQTGIPYIQYTSNNYSGGSSYTSGTEGWGIGDDTLNKSTVDRVFHIDLTTAYPTMPGYAWPQTGETVDAGNIELTWTNLLPDTGSDVWVDVWFGTDPDTNFNKIVNAGLNQTSVIVDATADGRYYWQVNTYLNGSSSGSPAEGQLFTFYVDETAEPDTISALNALKDHILGNTVLTDTQIAAHKTNIDTNKSLFGTSQGVISAALDLVEAYDANPGDGRFGPLWIDSYPPSRDYLNDDFVCTMYYVMQHIVDITYSANSLAQNETLLDGFKFASSAVFPGSVDPPATIETHTATINASYPDTAGWERQGDTLAARKPTGTYLAPGTVVTVTVPPELVNSGYMVRVGAHSWDLSHRKPIKRLERSSIVFPIESTQVKVANPLGGGIYIEVPYRVDKGVVNVDITGAVRSPFYSHNTVTGHITTLEQWQNVERNYPAPWADFQTEKYMCQVPTSYIYAFDDPVTAMANWDAGIDVFNDLMGFPRDRGKETIYTQIDVINRSSVFAPGYPAVNYSDSNPTADRGGNSGAYLIHGPMTSAHIEIHEHAHAYFFPKFGGESESTVNLPHAAIMNQTFGYNFDDSLAASFGYLGNPHRTLNNTAIAWMCSFNFSPREVPMHTYEKQYQLKGHAKFVDIAKMFGWQVLNDFWKSFVDEYEANGSYDAGSNDDKLLRLSKAVGVDIRPLFHFWGIHPSDPNALKTAIEAEGLEPSLNIYNRLLEYKAVLPNNNAEFQAYCLNWWGRQPSINGYWTETEHARQWDEQILREQDLENQQRPDGEIYTENSAAEIRDVIDRLIVLYYPNGSPAYAVELDDMISWSGEPISLDPNVVNNGSGDLSYYWSATPEEGVVFSDVNVQNPTVTITKPEGSMSSFTLTLTVDDGVSTPVSDFMTVDVYDDPCQASRLGKGIIEKADINGDCIIDLNDIAVMASNWMKLNGLESPRRVN